MANDKPGIFISLEGPDGAGKTTQLKLLSKYLDSINCQYIITRDPGGTPLGKQIRRILLHAETAVDPVTELLLYQADRAQHVSELIGPSLSKGLVVLCDRYVDSTLAYQGFGRNLDLALIRQLNEIATGGLMPELTILFDIDSQSGLSRLHPSGHDRLEREAMDFHTRVRNGYLELAKAEPKRWQIIDASRAMSAVQEDLQRIVADKLGVAV